MKHLTPEQLHAVWLQLPEADRVAYVRSLAPEARAALVAHDPQATAPDAPSQEHPLLTRTIHRTGNAALDYLRATYPTLEQSND